MEGEGETGREIKVVAPKEEKLQWKINGCGCTRQIFFLFASFNN